MNYGKSGKKLWRKSPRILRLFLNVCGQIMIKKKKNYREKLRYRKEKEPLKEINGISEPIQASNFRITDDELGQGTAKEKFRANIMAIQFLKKCEEENRNATPDEQEILSRYVGWGGLADAFDETKAAWETEYLELKTVLTPEEYLGRPELLP